MRIFKSRLIHKIGILVLALIIVVVGTAIINTNFRSKLSNLPGEIAGALIGPDYTIKFKDNFGNNLVSFVGAQGATGPYQDVDADVIISGNVGIGISNPGTNKLYVQGGTYLNGFVEVPNTVAAAAFVNRGALNLPIGTDTGGGDLQLITNAATRVTVKDTSGNVGIGITGPQARLDLGQLPTLTEGLRIKIGATGTPFSPLAIVSASNADVFKVKENGSVCIGDSTIPANCKTTWPAGGTSQWTTSGTDIYYNTGNVGIGIANPARPLVVYNTSPFAQFVNATTGTTQFDGLIVGHNGSNAYLFNYENNSLGFGTNGTEKMTILSNGNVGIGTQSPSAKFDVKTGTNHIGFLDWGIPALAGWNDGFTAWSNIMLAPAGNVGIGIAPGYRLHVAGDIYADGGWLRSSGTNGWYSETYGGGWYMSDTSWIRTLGDKNIWTGVGLLGSNGGLTVGYGGTGAPSGGAIIAGNVGIGTQTPGRRLEVNNTMKFTNIGGTDANDGVIGVAGFAPGLNIIGVQTDGAGRKVSVWGYTTFVNGHAADLAENYFTSGKVVRGSLVSIDYKAPSTAISADVLHKTLLGIVTTNPGAVMDADGGFQIGYKTKSQYTNEKAPIALVGTVPALVTSQNGLISIGDPIGLTSLSGFGAKAKTPGQIVGRALEKFNPTNSSCPIVSSVDAITWPEDNGKNPAKPCYKLPDGTYIGKIMVSVGTSWYDPDTYLTSTDNFQLNLGELKDSANNLITRIGAFANLIVGKIQAGIIETQKLIVSGVDVMERINNLSQKVDNQQKEIDALKAEIESLKR